MNFFKKNEFLIGIAAIWLAILFVVGLVSPALSTYQDKKCTIRNYPSYYRWDSSWYTQISQRGYNFSTQVNSSIAYWPLYPFTIKILHAVSPIHIGYVSTTLSILYAVLSIFLLYKLSRLEYDKKTSKVIVAVFLFFPSTYFLVTGYPESLFVLLTLLSFYLARKQNWLGAGISGALLALTKPYGFLIIATLLWEYLQAKNWQPNWRAKKYWESLKDIQWAPLLLPLASVFGFMIFNYQKFKTPVAFLLAEKTWGRSIGNPFLALLLEGKDYLNPPAKLATGAGFPYIIYVLSFFFFLWAMYISWQKVRTSYLLFTALSMLTAFMTGTLTSWDRYMMISVASLIGVGVYLVQKKYALITYLLISAPLLILLASLFVRCYPVE